MHLDRRIRIQLAVFLTVSLFFLADMVLNNIDVPQMLFGTGHYRVTMKLTESAGLYERSIVTDEWTEVGRVDSFELTDTGVDAHLSLRSGVDIPSNLEAEVHSQSAVGEQFVALLPLDGSSPPLRDGDVIPEHRTSVPPSITGILDSTNTALQALPQDALKTVVDESATAFGGLGPELSRLVESSTILANDARANLDSLTGLIDGAAPVLNSQSETAHSIVQWADNTAVLTGQLRAHDTSVANLLTAGPEFTGQARHLIERLKPSVPVLLANLVSLSKIAIVYRANLEQLLVLVPQSLANTQATSVATRNDPPGPYRSGNLSFNTNINLPPVCTTGYLPAQTRRSPAEVDFPDRPVDDLFCRVPQDSAQDVRGIRNIPCETKPWKRAPTVAICESDQEYVPLNDGNNWKGDPNATLSGQPVPAPRPPDATELPMPPATVAQPAPPPAAPIAVAEYDAATGTYIGPDGKTYLQADLVERDAPQTWQSMLLPPAG